MRNPTSSKLLLVFLILAGSRLVFAWSGSDLVVAEGDLLSRNQVRRLAWPEGVLDLVNDPVRTMGFWPFFSEHPNDSHEYLMKLADTDDANRLLRKLSKIRASKKQVRLSPAREVRGLMWGNMLSEGNRTAALFTIGSQKVVDEWFARLPEDETGVRVFGVNRYTKPPIAGPPTLTLYVGSDHIDLEKLAIPLNLDVTAANYPRGDPLEEPLRTAIDQFVQAHEQERTEAERRLRAAFGQIQKGSVQ